MKKYLLSVLFIILFGFHEKTCAQKSLEIHISDSLTAITNHYTFVGKVSVIGFSARNNLLSVSVSEKMSYMPFRPDNVRRIYNAISTITSKKYPGYSVACLIDNRKIEEFIPNYYKTSNLDETRFFAIPPVERPLVTNSSRPYDIPNGMQNRHIALWQSHGWNFSQKKNRWEWQRPRLMQTVEDLYTQSFVLPYLVPMLEKAGANVLLPRERDTQSNEVIVDNDSKDNLSRYRELNDRKRWVTGDTVGFAHPKKFYLNGENPFTLGTYRQTTTVIYPNEASTAEWIPNIPEAGKYAVYVSYKTVPNSTSNARYIVYHRGVKTEFLVNQTMNGGSWLYLGHFYFDKGRNSQDRVVLSNFSSEEGKIITADAVKFGGGMGNVARSPYVSDSVVIGKILDSIAVQTIPPLQTIKYVPDISHRPRYTEGARYWLQWSGAPDSVYSRTKWQNDYSDDFQSRGFWVNYLAGGSSVLPTAKGKSIPIDLAMAFHSDAGSTLNDSIIGTLGICTVKNTAGSTVFANGVSRWASRDLTDIIQTQVVDDVRKLFAPEWVRRGLWNKSYSESRNPEVPTMLLEFLSHQNFADMRYGLDPRFRFTVSRAVYKGILRYLSFANKTGYVVQPLPVEQFSCRFTDKYKLRLHWKAVVDSLEPTATAEKYVIYTRIDDGDFDNGVVVGSTAAEVTIMPGKQYSFKVTAVNQGGESFPSEVLSAYRATKEKGEVLIVNGFTRLSAPASFVIDSTYAGFLNDIDAGVPYMADISFVGKQKEFLRQKAWVDDDAPGFGGSNSDYETTVIAGNTFDYPALHGKSIRAAGYSYVSSSEKAVVNGDIDLNDFKFVDIILGKQKQTFVGNAKKAPDFKTFPLALQQLIQGYCRKGGNLLMSGAYIGSDLCEKANVSADDKSFIENTLKIKLKTSHAVVNGNVTTVASPFKSFAKAEFSYVDRPDSVAYYVESPDAIEANGEGSFTICRYTENNLGAAVAYSGAYKTCLFGFPFEAIKTEKDRDSLMDAILSFFNPPAILKKQ